MRELAMNSSDVLSCLSTRGDGVLLQLSVMPNAKRTEVDGLHDGALRVRLAAPPIEGRANEALVAWLAKSLGIPKRDVELLRGESSRRKQVAIAVSHEVAARWLAERCRDQRPR
ncbi:MAG: DUF167 domain-containing protein [Vitreoscilla sp.]